jgi:hypothetical protein
VNWTLIFVRAYWRGLAVFGTAIVVAIPLASVRGALLEPLATAGTWIVGAGAMLALGMIGAATLRLRAWEKESMHPCKYCSGPLGHRRDGVRRLSDFRSCLNCSRNTPEPEA